MFEGKAEEAITMYTSLFEDSSIVSVNKHEEDGPLGKKGKIQKATFKIKGIEIMAIDSSVKHEFTFTPSNSFFITCNDEQEIDKCFLELSKDGKVLMDLGNYGFSEKFGWVNDKFGVSWQLNLDKK